MAYDIVTIGSATRDVFVNVADMRTGPDARFPVGASMCLPFGSKIEIDKVLFASGGGATNAAVTFARQGLATACIGAIGQDGNGRDILDELRREGVDGKYMQAYDDDITAYSVVLVGTAGERTILTYKGEGKRLDVKQIPFSSLTTKWLYLNSLGGHIEVLEEALAWAHREGVRVAINPGGTELALGLDRLRPLYAQCDIVALNQEEAGRLLGIAYDNTDEIFRAMDAIVDGIFILTRGQKGSMVSDGRTLYAAGVPAAGVIDRTGAGDAFCSGFVAEYMRTHDIPRAIRFATANASAVVAAVGAKTGILKTGELGQWPLVGVDQRDLVS